jgi:hypothetical protein
MKNQKLFEAIADIAFIAGENGYFTGDSRADVFNFIYWANQFEQEHIKTNWDEIDYLLEIEKFTLDKIQFE